MSVTYTRQDVITQVMANLRKLGNDTAPQDEDNGKVDGVFDACVDSLSARNIYTVSDPGTLGPTGGAIEAAAHLDLALCVAWAAAPRFNMAGNQTLAALAAQAESNLELIAAPPRTLRGLRIESGLLPAQRRGTYTGL